VSSPGRKQPHRGAFLSGFREDRRPAARFEVRVLGFEPVEFRPYFVGEGIASSPAISFSRIRTFESLSSTFCFVVMSID